jgi:hypothetical protein
MNFKPPTSRLYNLLNTSKELQQIIEFTEQNIDKLDFYILHPVFNNNIIDLSISNNTEYLNYIYSKNYIHLDHFSIQNKINYILNSSKTLFSEIPISWYPLYFYLKTPKILTKDDNNIITVDNLFSYSDNVLNLYTYTYFNTTLYIIKDIILPPLVSHNNHFSSHTLPYMGKIYILSPVEDYNIEIDNSNCNEVISTIMNSFPPEIKSSIIRVVNYYTNHLSFKTLNSYIKTGKKDNIELEEIISILNKIIYDVSLNYRQISSSCNSLILFRGVPVVNSMPIFKGSIINSYRNKFISFSDDLKKAYNFSNSNIIIVLKGNMSRDYILPITEIQIDGQYVGSVRDEREYLLPMNTSLIIIEDPFLYNNYTFVTTIIYNQSLEDISREDFFVIK